jgi:predicted nucleic acid-binding protein
MNKIFFDTNILLRLTDENSSQHELVAGAVAVLLARGVEFCFAPQSIIKFWGVATRPAANNGLGWDFESVQQAVETLIDDYELLPEIPTVFEQWLELVIAHSVVGKQVHDTKLVAAMLTHKIDQILTLNTADFTRFSQIKAIHPSTILEEAKP